MHSIIECTVMVPSLAWEPNIDEIMLKKFIGHAVDGLLVDGTAIQALEREEKVSCSVIIQR